MIGQTPTLDAALDYVRRGWHVLALEPREKLPAPLADRGRRLSYDEATVDPAQVVRWWQACPEANVGIRCDGSGLLVLDVDPRHGGDEGLHDLEAELGQLPETVRAETGGGGQHLAFQPLPDGAAPVRSKPAPGLDVKWRGYIVAPPSTHPSGRPYAWDLEPGDAPIAQLPEAWIERLTAPTRPEPAEGEAPSGGDFLRTRLPAEYVRLLCGREPGTDGKIICPFHDDSAPSLHVYETAEKGWFCYGCERGGSIFEFAAHLAGYPVPLRGAAYLRIEDALLRTYAEKLGVPEAVA